MSGIISIVDCVRIPDGGIAQVRAISKNEYGIRVKRKGSKDHIINK
jgi:hypothetical protein